MDTRIIIADDHGLVRAGLRMLVNSEPDFRVVGEAEDGHVALKLAEELCPEILLADISMPGPSGIELAAELRQRVPVTRVLIVSMHEDQSIMHAALSAGAAGYLTKRALEQELIRAIRTVSEGGTYLTPGLPTHAPVTKQAPEGSESLSEGELKILRALAGGMTTKDTAKLLDILPSVVEDQRVALFKKLGLHNRVDLINYANQHALLA